MKYAFTRNGHGIEDWCKVNREMAANLEEIRRGNCTEDEMKGFLLQAAKDANVYEEEEMAFWNFADPNTMPSDARCDFVYRPTYLMTLSMVNIINKAPEMMDYVGVRDTLRRALNACAGRGLRGSGIDDYDGLCENVLLFMQNGSVKFMRDWPLFSIQFEMVFRYALNEIERDHKSCSHTENWESRNCKEIKEMIVQLRSKTGM